MAVVNEGPICIIGHCRLELRRWTGESPRTIMVSQELTRPSIKRILLIPITRCRGEEALLAVVVSCRWRAHRRSSIRDHASSRWSKTYQDIVVPQTAATRLSSRHGVTGCILDPVVTTRASQEPCYGETREGKRDPLQSACLTLLRSCRCCAAFPDCCAEDASSIYCHHGRRAE
jgi:hypothetical protein